MNRFDKHEKGDKIKWAIIFTVVAALIVGFFAIVTKGFKQNDPKKWFGKVEPATVQNRDTVEIATGTKQGVLSPDSQPVVTYNYSTGMFEQNFSVSYNGLSLIRLRLRLFKEEDYDPSSAFPLVCASTSWSYYSSSDYFNFYVIEGDKNSTSTNKVKDYYILGSNNYDIPLNYISLSASWVYYKNGYHSCETEFKEENIESGNYYVEFSYSYGNPDTFGGSFSDSNILRVAIPISLNVSSLPETPNKDGYTFIGWYLDEALTNPYTGGAVTSDMQLYAKFEPINYNIVYNANDGTVNGKTSYNIESETYTLPLPARTGYNFLGWYDNANFTGEAITEIPKGSTGDKTYYAKWEIQTFKVSFYVDGELYLEMDVEYGTSLVNLYLVDTTTMAAVAFSLDAEMLTSYSMDSLITNDLSLFAANDFVIYAGLTYNIDGVETMDLLDYNSTLSDLRVPEKDGYTFDGWFYDAEYTKAVSSTDKLTSNKTIYAKFTALPKTTFWTKLGAFFRQWWWAFVAGGAVIILAVTVTVIEKKRKR